MNDQTDSGRKRVLIVEDEPRMGEILGRAIPELGYEATVVRTGEQALQTLDDSPHAIAVLDLNLPGMSGLDCLREIRQQWPDTQAIILTGFGDLDAAKEAIHLDVVEFLTKPAHLGELEVALSRAEQRLRSKDIDRLGREYEAQQALQRARNAAGKTAPAPDDAHAHAEPDDDADPGPTSLKDLERKAILETLARHEGNREATADELGISVRTLYYRLKEYQDEGYL
jgi:DNA-binding NtrC family response regulator